VRRFSSEELSFSSIGRLAEGWILWVSNIFVIAMEAQKDI
jgi:hypothetical protein